MSSPQEAELTGRREFGYLMMPSTPVVASEFLRRGSHRKGRLVKPVSSAPLTRQSIAADVLSWGTVRAWPEQLAQWRKQPSPMPPEPFSPALIRHSEEQTIAALWATCEAAASMDAKPDSFANWGVIAAPRLMGRAGNASAFERFRDEGPWGISPHMIPHHSLHAVSGTISQILKTHGPNFGVGNGPRSSSEGWLTAATLLSEGILPGLWLVIVGHVDEYIPSQGDAPASRLECEAAAFALAPSRGSHTGLHLRICPEDLLKGGPINAPFLASMPDFSLTQLVDELGRRDAPPAGMWRLPGAGWIEIEMR